MATKMIPCRVCGKMFKPCSYCESHADVFRYRNFACSIECAKKYIDETIAYRKSLHAEESSSDDTEESVKKTRKKTSKKKTTTDTVDEVVSDEVDKPISEDTEQDTEQVAETEN